MLVSKGILLVMDFVTTVSRQVLSITHYSNIPILSEPNQLVLFIIMKVRSKYPLQHNLCQHYDY